MEHYCGLRELDYSRVLHGLIVCNVCGRRWTLHPIFPKGAVWSASPPCKPMPATALWPLPDSETAAKREAEYRDTRQARLNELDRIARERADEISETLAAWDRWQRRGGGIKVNVRKVWSNRPDRKDETPAKQKWVFTHKSVFRP